MFGEMGNLGREVTRERRNWGLCQEGLLLCLYGSKIQIQELKKARQLFVSYFYRFLGLFTNEWRNSCCSEEDNGKEMRGFAMKTRSLVF